jgi:negative regulator of flagellin synthesis FlgM
MEIHGLNGAGGAQPIFPRLAANTVDSGSSIGVNAPRDHVEISSLGRMLEGIHSLPDIRHERVEAIRQQIAQGVYETPEKLEIALDRMLDELSGF